MYVPPEIFKKLGELTGCYSLKKSSIIIFSEMKIASLMEQADAFVEIVENKKSYSFYLVKNRWGRSNVFLGKSLNK